jgi:hypothetical protein
VGVGVAVGVPVGVAVGVTVGVAVGVLVGVSVGVAVGVPVGVAVGVGVGVAVGVEIGETVGVAVGVPVGVAVGMGVGVAVGVAVGVPAHGFLSVLVPTHRDPFASFPENVAMKLMYPEVHCGMFIRSLSPLPPLPITRRIGHLDCVWRTCDPSTASIVSVVSNDVPLTAVPLRIRALAVTSLVRFSPAVTVGEPARSALTSIWSVHAGIGPPAWDSAEPTAMKTPVIQISAW